MLELVDGKEAVFSKIFLGVEGHFEFPAFTGYWADT